MQNQISVIDDSEQARQIAHLSDEFDGLSHWANHADSFFIQKCRDERFVLRSRLVPLVSRRSYLAGEWNRLAGEVDGCQRALELINTLRGGDDAASSPSMGFRIRGRLEVRAVEAVGFKADLSMVDERIAKINVEIAVIERDLITALERAVGVAESERTAQAAGLEAARQSRMRNLMMSDPTVMWSPSPVIGFRIWTLRRTGFRGSSSPWPSSSYTATCEAGADVPHTDGRCARVAFGCGVYVAKDVRELISEFDVLQRRDVAVGLVIMTGKVIEHESGYRAESTQVISLAVLDRDWVTFVEGANAVAEAFSNSERLKSVGHQSKRPTGHDRVETMLVQFFDAEAKGTEAWTLATNNE